MPAMATMLVVLSMTGGAGVAVERYHCQPTLETFCRNVHVGCAGRTGIKTKPFTVSVANGKACVMFSGQVEETCNPVDPDADWVIRFGRSGDWVRIDRARRFSHRIYRHGEAAMSYGRCQPACRPQSFRPRSFRTLSMRSAAGPRFA